MAASGSSVDKWLNDDEQLVADLHPHWLYFWMPSAVLVAGIAVGIFAMSRDTDWIQKGFGWIAIAAIVVALLWLVERYISWRTSHFIVTDDRVIYRSGWVRKHGIDIPLERINTIQMRQGVFERMTGTGDLMIESAGENGLQRFSNIHKPDQVQKLIYKQMNLQDEQGRQPIVTQSDAASQLEKLEGMLQRGSLTQEEFDAQKRKLLG
ncbi:MAG: PH domain-containing protein [Ilumatobacteraceae bacterium]|jgi:uncharacterized membrane protein YdbT with pleckstrin-like domain|nr:PH domain-containing protein [Ilumatobacteraceae bacterium]